MEKWKIVKGKTEKNPEGLDVRKFETLDVSNSFEEGKKVFEKHLNSFEKEFVVKRRGECGARILDNGKVIFTLALVEE